MPALASEAIWSSGASPARMATTTAVASVIRVGTPRELTLASAAGSRPSRAMTKKMRLWPNRKARITVGRAITAAAPMAMATPPWPSPRRISASGSGLVANRAVGIAPIAVAATAT